jgi:hypothetical protein
LHGGYLRAANELEPCRLVAVPPIVAVHRAINPNLSNDPVRQRSNPVRCTVLDQSEMGALLELRSILGIPDRFQLTAPRSPASSGSGGR